MNLHVAPIEIDIAIPPLHRSDDKTLNLRKIVAERIAYGVGLSVAALAHIQENGYESYFMGIAKVRHRLGGKNFRRLREKGRLDLTSEYILFHHFRGQLDADTRRRIATLLAESVSHPHARWESRTTN